MTLELWKTTILPTDDAQLAQSMLRHWIHEVPVALIVALGKDEIDERFVTRADSLTGDEATARRVIWARDGESIRPVLVELATAKFPLEQLMGAHGFALALNDDVRDLIKRKPGGDAPDLARIFLAWSRAEA